VDPPAMAPARAPAAAPAAVRQPTPTPSPPPKRPKCLCVPATYALGASAACAFLLGLAVLVLNVLLLRELDLSEYPVWRFLLATGVAADVLLLLICLAGIAAARSGSRFLLTAHFFATALFGAGVFTGIVYLALEYPDIRAYVRDNWEDVQHLFSARATQESASAFLRVQTLRVAGIYAGLLGAICLGLGATERIVGLPFIYGAAQVVLALIGLVAVVLGLLLGQGYSGLLHVALIVSGSALAVAALLGFLAGRARSETGLVAVTFVLAMGTIAYLAIAVHAFRVLEAHRKESRDKADAGDPDADVGHSRQVAELGLTMAVGFVSGFWAMLCLALSRKMHWDVYRDKLRAERLH